MQSAHDPPGFIAPARWVAAGRPFELPERAAPAQDWLTADGWLRTDLESSRDVQLYEASAHKMAMGQIMSVGQTLFFLWMVGGQLSLWSIMFLLQGGPAPFFALMRVHEGAPRFIFFRPPHSLPPSLSPLPLLTPHAPRAPRAAFAQFAVNGAKLGTAKGIYVAINLVGCGIVLWKLRSIGLLPLTSADWVQLLPPKRFVEFSGSAFGGVAY